MTWWEWTILGVVVWALLVWAICLANYRFWNHVDPQREWRG